MTSSQIRQSFFDFFRSKGHTIVPSSSLMPDSPNLLFTNAGMNQFVPIFLGQVKCPYTPPRAADTQKCIRAGGKHNDLDDVGLDTYHHTFFEMLGNWSFGDYFKKEAIDWAWELITEVWKFPKERLYATVYSPDKAKSDPSDFDQEAYDFWAAKFQAAGLDPKVHIVPGNKKDNFWMMGETGPCGPCSELHVDLTPNGDTKGALVNKGSPLCIEIWNLVFIQFNANPDGTFAPLPAQHVDTGMGFERVTSILQCTKNFTDFTGTISNYETDIFRPIFDALEKMSGKKYGSTLPSSNSTTLTEAEKIDIAFRVIADHIRTLSFAIADGIQPGNTDRNYVLRRILRRAVRYGRSLGFHLPFFYKLVDVLADKMGEAFPELVAKRQHIQSVIQTEEEAFNKTLDAGLKIFRDLKWEMERNRKAAVSEAIEKSKLPTGGTEFKFESQSQKDASTKWSSVSAEKAFLLYDTYGFPLDLTELMARESGFNVDKEGFEKLMEEQRTRARAAQKKEVISLSDIGAVETEFVGYENLKSECRILNVSQAPAGLFAVVDVSPLYAEMGGQVGDSGTLTFKENGKKYLIVRTIKHGKAFLLLIAETDEEPWLPLKEAPQALLEVDSIRRLAIERHHTVTHLLHWALHEVVSKELSQKGSYVGPEKLTFDFNSAALTPEQVAEVEKLVNEKILENAVVSWTEVPHSEVKNRKDVMQFFGDKYGDLVRVVQIGGGAQKLDGYSMELCGGTHVRGTGEIGSFRIVSESAVAGGVRRIEAVAGLRAYQLAKQDNQRVRAVAELVSAPVSELEKKVETILAQQRELEKQLKAFQQKQAAGAAKGLIAKAIDLPSVAGAKAIVENLGSVDGDYLQAVADGLKSEFKGVVVLGGSSNGAVSLVATVSADFTASVQAGKIIQGIAPIVGGKGGGKPDNARGGGKDVAKLNDALAEAKKLLTR